MSRMKQANLLPPETLRSVTSELPAEIEGVFDHLVHDRVLQVLFAASLLVNLTLFAYLALRFDLLPDNLPLHFDVLGLPDRIEAKSSIFGLAIIGLIVFLVNGVLGMLTHRQQRAASLILAVSALLIQILIWFAMINIIGGLV
jgi:uncharacterized membrane protein